MGEPLCLCGLVRSCRLATPTCTFDDHHYHQSASCIAVQPSATATCIYNNKQHAGLAIRHQVCAKHVSLLQTHLLHNLCLYHIKAQKTAQWRCLEAT